MRADAVAFDGGAEAMANGKHRAGRFRANAGRSAPSGGRRFAQTPPAADRPKQAPAEADLRASPANFDAPIPADAAARGAACRKDVIQKMLDLQNITWSAPDGEQILNGVSLTVPDDTLMVVTGPNGGGKTTLAKVIAGLETPASGRILLDGEDITGLNVTERARRGVSYAFQQPVRFKGLVVRQLLELAAGGKLSEAKLCDVLSQVGLCAREYIDREVNATLSGGEIKRIEIATVLLRHSRLTIFDEPEAGIDLWSFNNLIAVFQSLRSALHGSMVIISHQERILQIADEIAVISGGQLARQGSAAEILPDLMRGADVAACCRQKEAFAK